MPIKKVASARLVKQQVPYETVSRELVQSITNPVALAIWVYLLTKPEDWIVRRAEILAHFDGLGRPRYEKAMRELREMGLVWTHVVQDEAGKITDSVMVVEALPTVYTENRVPGKPAIRENRPLTDTEINYRYREYTKGKSTRSISMEEQLNDTSWAYENE